MPADPSLGFPPPEPTPTFPYRVEARVGEGAMGIVYRGRDPVLDRAVAIKTVRPELLGRFDKSGADELSRRFVQEARAAAAISHPAVTIVYGAGVERGVPFMAMEWLEGETLEDLLEREGPQPEERIIAYGAVLCDALDAAHAAGVVHRDVKPGNVMVLADGRLKITDFGIARVQHSRVVQTQAGLVVGTPAFAAPEQLAGRAVDGRADLYALTVVLFVMATGQPPFDSEEILTLLHAVVNTPPPLARSLHPGVSPALERFLARGLAKDPAARFASAREMADELRAVAPGVAATVAGAAAAQDAPIARPGDDTLAALSAVEAFGGDAQRRVLGVVQGWEARPLPEQPIDALLERLLDRPLHAAAFSGALILREATLLVGDGLVHGAFGRDGTLGDEALEGLATMTSPTLHPLPPERSPALIPALASLLLPPAVRLGGLDATVTNLPRLADKLAAEAFDGVLRLRVADDEGWVIFHRGDVIFELMDTGLPRDPWTTWVEERNATASVEEHQVRLPLISYRRELRDATLEIRPGEASPASGAGRTRTGHLPAVVMQVVGARQRGSETMRHLLGGDPACRVLRWLLDEAVPYFEERGREAGWKYLIRWVPLARRAWVYHELQRPHAAERDFFDAVTADEGGKVLHLARRAARGTVEALDAFVEDVIAAKTARLKTGDVGAALLVAPSFTDEALASYRSRTAPGEARSWVLGLQSSLTRYEGFIRLGAKRGFHLLLLEDHDGVLQPVLP